MKKRYWVLLILTIFALALSIRMVRQGQAQDSSEYVITHGPMSGEVSSNAVTLWARANADGELLFEISSNANFSEDIISESILLSAENDFTGEIRFTSLESSTEYYYQVKLEGSDSSRSGNFKTAPASDDAAEFSFVFGACLGGQGYCRDPETGWIIFDQMAAVEPDFFIITGDTIYSDSVCPIETNVAGAENIEIDLEGFRSRYQYHLEDEHYASFLADTPIFVTWDDHEVRDNFGGPELSAINPQLLAEGTQAFFEYLPLMIQEDGTPQIYRQVNYGANADIFFLDTRSYRDPLVNWDPSPQTLSHKTMLGEEQFAWLQDGLNHSEATWKFIVSSVPVGYPTGFPQPEVDGRDSWANGADRSGYETELMRLLFYIEAHDIENVIFLTGDTHWPYALSYDPDLDGEPNFYELSSSPMSAIVLPPTPVDQTFNPTVLYAEGEFQGSLFNFGHISVEADGNLTFRIIDRDGVEHYSLSLSPN